MKTESIAKWIVVVFVVISLLAIVICLPYSLSQVLAEVTTSIPEVILPTLVIMGVVGLLVALTLVAIAFSALGLSESGQALSLPRGSVRALIALILILIFMITGIHLFNQVANTDDPPSDKAISFAQQILTTLSTLVVAVAGFYYGTRAVEVARGEVEERERERERARRARTNNWHRSYLISRIR